MCEVQLKWMKIPFWKVSVLPCVRYFPAFFISFLLSLLSLFLKYLKREINATLISKVIKMYYESPALSNLTVCENALNVAGTKERRTKKIKKQSERGWGRARKGGGLHNGASSAEGELRYFTLRFVCLSASVFARTNLRFRPWECRYRVLTLFQNFWRDGWLLLEPVLG